MGCGGGKKKPFKREYEEFHFFTIGPMIPQTEEDYVTYRPLGQLCKITTNSAKVSR